MVRFASVGLYLYLGDVLRYVYHFAISWTNRPASDSYCSRKSLNTARLQPRPIVHRCARREAEICQAR